MSTNHITTILNTLDIDIRTLAEFLNVSKSTLHGNIEGSRILPDEGDSHLKQLKDQLNAKSVHREILPGQLAQEQKELEAHKEKSRLDLAFNLKRLERKLAAMEVKYKKSHEVMQNLSYILITTNGTFGDFQQSWLDSEISRRRLIIDECSLIKQWELKKKIEAIKSSLKL